MAARRPERQTLKVGEVARRTGLTVRALHHYDDIGLLTPSEQTESGHRLYTAEDLARLHRIVSLRQLGFSLDEIREALARPETTLLEVVEWHLAASRKQLERTRALCRRLEAMASRLREGRAPDVDELLENVEEITMYEKFFTPAQASELKAKAKAAGPAALRDQEKRWQDLARRAKAELDRGTPPEDPRVQALAAEWQAMVDELTGGDEGLYAGLVALYRADPDAAAHRLGPDIDRRVTEYVGRARAKKA